MSEAVFEVDGDRFLPTDASRAGWYPDALHGGPVAALFARAMERVEAPVPMMVVRLTVDLLRPVPTRPLTVVTDLSRPGKRIQVIGFVHSQNGRPIRKRV